MKKDACAVYRIIADAESEVHGKDVYEIHFHEVGNMDAVADVVGVCMLINELKPDRILASPVHVGSGSVKCAHGTLPVPAPATALILEGVPIYSGSIQGELCTPTGAALLKYFAGDFCAMPPIRVEKIGYGIGTRDFEAANVLRAFLGETEEKREGVYELCANIDDMTGEDIAYAAERILKGGALDVYTVPIGMKKGRPGVMLCALCKEENREETARLIFNHTSTIGVREQFFTRRTLERREVEIETNFGTVRGKEAYGYGVKKIKPEHDDLIKLAEEKNIAISEIKACELK